MSDLDVEQQAVECERFRNVLYRERQVILARAQRALSETMTVDEAERVDEMDFAIADNQQRLEMRMRGRERVLLRKIERALERLEGGEYFECDHCGEDISLNRLRARPVTNVCIRCKEEQEMYERRYA